MLARDAISVLVAYLLGSVPFAYLVTRWRIGQDIRQVGVGNGGARNVWHVVGHGWGVAVAVLDITKGLLAVNVARALGVRSAALYLAGPAAIIGHDFPLFRKFQGGKGLSATVGILLAWMPEPTLASLGIFGVLHLLLRNFDRSSAIGAISAIFLPLAFGYNWPTTLYALVLFVTLAVRQLQDLSHERRVWARSGWEGVARTDWHGEAGDRRTDHGQG